MFPEALILVFQNMRLFRNLCRSADRVKMYYNKPPNRHVIDREFLAFSMFSIIQPHVLGWRKLNMRSLTISCQISCG